MANLPWTCTVEGVPASVQGSPTKRDAWKSKVRASAEKSWSTEPLEVNIQVGITFFYLGSYPDVDNILKCTIDGLVGCVIADDSLVTDVRGSLRNIEYEYTLAGPNIDLADKLAAGVPFVQITVEDSPNLQELP